MEHYAGCCVVQDVARSYLGLSFRFDVPLRYWMFAAPDCLDAERDHRWWPKVAKLLYAVMRVTNAARHSQSFSPEVARQGLRQALVEASGGAKV